MQPRVLANLILEMSAQTDNQCLGEVSNKAIWASVSAPKDVVKSASLVLTGDPASWDVNNEVNFDSQPNHVVCLTDSAGKSLIYLITKNRWIRLNNQNGIPYINDVMKNYLAPNDLKNPNKLATYLENIAYLYRGPSRVVLSKNLLNKADKDLKVWLQGREKNVSIFRSLFADPIPVSHGDISSVVCNVITNFGSVEAWDVDLKVGSSVQISKITIHQIHEKGTFSYGLVGG
jgi:hypothetical protein